MKNNSRRIFISANLQTAFNVVGPETVRTVMFSLIEEDFHTARCFYISSLLISSIIFCYKHGSTPHYAFFENTSFTFSLKKIIRHYFTGSNHSRIFTQLGYFKDIFLSALHLP